MVAWNELLEHLAEVPRENGTAAIHQAAIFLVEALERAGVGAETVPFTAQPYGLRLAGVLALAGGLLYLRWMRAGRPGAALAVAITLPALLLAQIDGHLPVFGWIGAQSQVHVAARLPARDPAQRLLFTAHYDTKTDLLDHVQRAPVDRLAPVVIPFMILGALCAGLAPRLTRGGPLLGKISTAAGAAGALYGLASFLALSAGALVPARSPGALDDGAACAVLVRLAGELAAAPPLRRTEVEIALLSAEEVGVQGSWEYAARRFAGGPGLPTAVVNLEGLGASSQHAVLGSERFTLVSFAPDPALVALLDFVHSQQFGVPLEVTAYGGATDARSFLARGIPAATVLSREPGGGLTRGLHSAEDSRARLDESALDASLAFLVAVARAADTRGF